jgi:hypothetical protein
MTPIQKAIVEMTRRFIHDEMEFKDANQFYSFREYMRSLDESTKLRKIVDK